MRIFIILLFITALTLPAQADSIAMPAVEVVAQAKSINIPAVEVVAQASSYENKKIEELNDPDKSCLAWAGQLAENFAADARKHYQKERPSDSEAVKLSKRTRNLCINDLYYVYWNEKAYECRYDDPDLLPYFPYGINPDFTIEQISGYLTLDYCLNANPLDIEKRLLNLGTGMTLAFLLNTARFVSAIEHGVGIDIYANIPSSPELCYSQDEHDDSIWHAIARSTGTWDWEKIAELCLTNLKQSENKTVELYQAVFLRTNDQGKTPIAEAVERGNLGRFSAFRDYFKQNNIDYKNLLRAAADEAGISYQKLSKAWEEGTELEVHKKIQLDKSGINIKTKYK